MSERKVVSAQVVACNFYAHDAQALLIVYEDGYVEVRCEHKEQCGELCVYLKK